MPCRLRAQVILHRDSLKDDLESKFMVIFHNYSQDLEAVQRLYEKQKVSPPMVRNATPVAGSVMWARQLMRRIEGPIAVFKQNSALMATKEAKKVVKVYNKIARTIIEYETLWLVAWTKGIASAKSGLLATLLVSDKATGKVFVNFDRGILQLLRETKALMRVSGVEVRLASPRAAERRIPRAHTPRACELARAHTRTCAARLEKGTRTRPRNQPR